METNNNIFITSTQETKIDAINKALECLLDVVEEELGSIIINEALAYLSARKIKIEDEMEATLNKCSHCEGYLKDFEATIHSTCKMLASIDADHE